MVEIVHQEKVAVRGHINTVSALELTGAPCIHELSVSIEDHHRVVAAIEDVDAVLPVDGHRSGLPEAHRVWDCRPSGDRLVDGCLCR